MSKLKTTLKEPDIDNRLLDDRGATAERLRRPSRADQSPIERAVARGTISEQHGRTAEQFHRYWRGARFPEMATNWKSEPSPGGIVDNIPLAKTELAAHHRNKYYQALEFIHADMDNCGMSQNAISLLHRIVCDEYPFEIAGKSIWPRMGMNAAGARAVTYIRGALRVLSIKWNIS